MHDASSTGNAAAPAARRNIFLWGCLCLLLCLASRDAAGDPAAVRRALGVRVDTLGPLQQIPRAAGAERESDLGISPPDENVEAAAARVVKAERLVAERQWAKAAAAFQDVLDRCGGAVLPVTGETYLPAWRYCALRLLAEPDVLAAYRAAYEAPARRAVDEASAARSRAALMGVVRRYGATRAAANALDVLSSIESERGHAAAAARWCLTRIELSESSAEHDAQFLAKLAAALAASGQTERLTRLAEVARAHYGEKLVRLNGSGLALSAWIERLVALHPASEAERPSASLPAVRPSMLLWEVPLPPPPPTPAMPQQPRAPAAIELARFQPAVHRGTLYWQSLDAVRALDLLTGRMLWKVNLPADANPAGLVRFVPPPADDIWTGTGVVVPTVTSDGVIVSLSQRSTVGEGDRMASAIFGRLDVLPTPPGDKPGMTVWSVTARDEARAREGEEQVPALRFVSGAVVAGDAVCVVARPAGGDTYLIGYGRRDGRRLWHTKIARSNWAARPEEPTLLSDEWAPLAEGGVVYCCSNQGTVAAVDATDGGLLWVTRYGHEDTVVCRFKTFSGGEAMLTAPPNPLFLAAGTLFALPSDSSDLLALDAATGALKWRRKRDEGNATGLHLLAADKEQVILAGSAVICVDAAFSLTRWRSPLFGDFPSGRGVVARDAVLVPLRGSVALVDFESKGKRVERLAWDASAGLPGNLLLLDGKLIVSSSNALRAYAAQDAARSLAVRREQEPEEPAHALELGVIRMKAGEIRAAADEFEAARTLLRKRGADTARADGLLAETYTRQAAELANRKAWKEAADVLAKVAALGPRHEPLVAAAAIRRAQALTNAGDVGGALAVLHDVLRNQDETWVQGFGDGRTVRAGLLAAVEVAHLIRAHGAKAYEAYETRAKAEAERRAAAHEAAFAALSRLYPNSEVTADLRLERAREALRRQRPATAAAELFAVRRLCPQYSAEKVSELADTVREATKPTKPDPRETPAPLLSVVWKTAALRAGTEIAERMFSESVADALPGERTLGPDDLLLCTTGKSLRAYGVADGKLAWRTGVGFFGVSFQEAAFSPGGLPRAAIEFLRIEPGFAAEKAGARAGDILISFGGQHVARRYDLVQFCSTTPPGTAVDVTVARGGKLVHLRPLIDERPEWIAGLSLQADPSQFIRVIGTDGDSLFADVDLVLLRLDRATGRLLERTVIGPLPDEMMGGGYATYHPPAARQFRTLSVRGHRPLLAEDGFVMPIPSGSILGLDLAGQRRWSFELSAPGLAAAPVVIRLVAWGGRAAALWSSVNRGDSRTRHGLVVLDTFSGERLFEDDFGVTGPPVAEAVPQDGGLKECQLVPAGNRLVAAVGKTLRCYDAKTGQRAWEIDAGDMEGALFSEVVFESGRVVALVNRRMAAAIDPQTGRLLWRAEPGGLIRRLLCGEGRVFLIREDQGRSAVSALNGSNGQQAWDTTVAANARAYGMEDSVPFAAAIDGKLFIVQNLESEMRPNVPANESPRATVAAVRISDGKLLRVVGLAERGGYNAVFGGKAFGGIIGLVTGGGLLGISTEGE